MNHRPNRPAFWSPSIRWVRHLILWLCATIAGFDSWVQVSFIHWSHVPWLATQRHRSNSSRWVWGSGIRACAPSLWVQRLRHYFEWNAATLRPYQWVRQSGDDDFVCPPHIFRPSPTILVPSVRNLLYLRHC